MAYPEEIIKHLTPLILQMGGVDTFNQLPEETVIEAMTHGDEILVVTDRSFLIQLEGILGSYSVYDAEFHHAYTVNVPIFGQFGREDIDIAWILSLGRGDFFYIAYDQDAPDDASQTRDRLLMVIRV